MVFVLGFLRTIFRSCGRWRRHLLKELHDATQEEECIVVVGRGMVQTVGRRLAAETPGVRIRIVVGPSPRFFLGGSVCNG